MTTSSLNKINIEPFLDLARMTSNSSTLTGSLVTLFVFLFLATFTYFADKGANLSGTYSDKTETFTRPSLSPTPTPTPVIINPNTEMPIDTSEKELRLSDMPSSLFGGPDVDCDGINAEEDNCPLTYNPDQKDSDENGLGEACDGPNRGRQESRCDRDGDGIPDYRDNCGLVCNPRQEDKNKNGIGDACDPAILKTWVRIQPCKKSRQRRS